MERRATAADPDLIRLIVDMLDPPSTHMVKMSRQLFSTPQSREVDNILKHKVNTSGNIKISMDKIRHLGLGTPNKLGSNKFLWTSNRDYT